VAGDGVGDAATSSTTIVARGAESGLAAIVRQWSGIIRGLCIMPVGLDMAGTGAIVRRIIGHLIRISGQFIVRLGLIRRIRVIGRLRIRGRREVATRGLDRRGMEMGILVLGLPETGMGIRGLVRQGMGTGIRGLVRQGMGASRAFSR